MVGCRAAPGRDTTVSPGGEKRQLVCVDIDSDGARKPLARVKGGGSIQKNVPFVFCELKSKRVKAGFSDFFFCLIAL